MTETASKRLITSERDLPDFDAMTRDEEATWWATHEVTERLWTALTPAERLAFERLLPVADGE